jgi:hypothetical protein
MRGFFVLFDWFKRGSHLIVTVPYISHYTNSSLISYVFFDSPLANRETQVSLFIMYPGMSGYSVAKPLIEQLMTLKEIVGEPVLPVTEVIAFDLDTGRLLNIRRRTVT